MEHVKNIIIGNMLTTPFSQFKIKVNQNQIQITNSLPQFDSSIPTIFFTFFIEFKHQSLNLFQLLPFSVALHWKCNLVCMSFG